MNGESILVKKPKDLKSMSKEELLMECELLQNQWLAAEGALDAYKKHLEDVLKYYAIENYQAVVHANREREGLVLVKANQIDNEDNNKNNL